MVRQEWRNRNGTESRVLLPLWKEDEGTMPSTMPSRKPVAVALQERLHRNGTESRNLLPLWKEDGGGL